MFKLKSGNNTAFKMMGSSSFKLQGEKEIDNATNVSKGTVETIGDDVTNEEYNKKVGKYVHTKASRNPKDIVYEKKFKEKVIRKQKRKIKRKAIQRAIGDDITRRIEVVKGKRKPRNWKQSTASCTTSGLCRFLGNDTKYGVGVKSRIKRPLTRRGTPRMWRRLVPFTIPMGFAQFGMVN